MKDSVKFSIITVTFNTSQCLEKTIQSIVSQFNFSSSIIEYIIVDGYSTDSTLSVVKKYESYISRWISELDNGIYDAMNKGLNLATGDYIWFINAGDLIYSENTIQKIIDKLDLNYLPDIIYGETEIIDFKGNSLGLRRLKSPEVLDWKKFRMGMLVCHQSFLVKRKIAENYNLQYKFVADYDWCIQCMKKANFIYNTHLVLSRFLNFGISTTYRKKSLKERYQIMCKNYGMIPTLFYHFWFVIRFYIVHRVLKKNKSIKCYFT